MLIHSDERRLWPDEASRIILEQGQFGLASRAQEALLLQRSGRLIEAEAVLLGMHQRMEDRSLIKELHCGYLVQIEEIEKAEILLTRYSSCKTSPDCDNYKGWALRTFEILLLKGENKAVIEMNTLVEEDPLFALASAKANLRAGRFEESCRLIELCEEKGAFPESTELKALLRLHTGRVHEAISLLNNLLERGVANAAIWDMVLHVSHGSKESYSVRLFQAKRHCPTNARLRSRAAAFELVERHPGKSRYNTLKERLLPNRSQAAVDIERSDSNLFLSYEHLGQTELLAHVQKDAEIRMAAGTYQTMILANRALQLASLSSIQYPTYVQGLARRFSPSDWKSFTEVKSTSKQSRKVALVTPDLDYHPVGRFVHMLLEAGLGTLLDLHIVATNKQGKGPTQAISQVISQCCTYHDFSKCTDHAHQLSTLREVQLDVAVDLAGWTSGNAAHLFGPRIAEKQVNYLGFFASSGLEAMDFWIGDKRLFPEQISEWSSESIWRLPRCFLAWQPCLPLPEAKVDVPVGPHHSDIVFGCFNHSRKLSSNTLRLWAAILHSIPGSRLALKAFTSDDPDAVELLRRRMVQAGIDQERIVWLSTCPDPMDHLRQYGLMDVALDPFPNGGCTTSCEALWMGVPVITLEGSHYVSRMTSAVLHGAKLDAWIANTEYEYLQHAIRAADNLKIIRTRREGLRQQVQTSELGDARGLAEHLSEAFKEMMLV